jgi:tetratricopeptide (TPR) repeat protein/DNA-binding CsgD family transcriptional regulator
MQFHPTTVTHALQVYRQLVLDIRNGRDVRGIDDLLASHRPIPQTVGKLCVGYRHHMQGNFRAAVDVYRKARAGLRSPSHDLLIALIDDATAWALLYLGRYDECTLHSMRMIQVAQQYNNERMEASGLSCLAQVYVSLGALQRGRRTMERALSMFQRLGLEGNIISTLNNLAWLAGREGKRTEERELLDEALRRLETFDDATSKAGILNADGRWYAAGGNHERAIECFQHAESIFEQLGYLNATAEVRVERAAALMRTGQIRKGEELARSARAIFRQTSHRRFEGHAEQTIAYAWYLLGNIPRCLKHLRQALRIAQDIGARADVVDITVAMAEIQAEGKNCEQAYRHATDAIAVLRTIEREAAADAGDDGMLVTHVERYLEQADYHRRAMVEARRTIAAAERERDDLRHQNEQNSLLIDAIDTLVRSGLRKRTDGGTLAREVLGIIAAYRTHTATATPAVEDGTNIDRNADILRKRVNGLTPATARVAAMVLAGMTTKDIAVLLRVSTRTVEHQRLRIRKALAVPPSVELVDAIRAVVRG